MASVAPRLPGIRVDVAPPPPAEALPRMDVAVLVGFAASGPLHVPVVVESVTQFAAVFGGDAPLAWDEARAERAYACLSPAVRAFFSNGGRRCWIIRVARTAALQALQPAGTPPLPVARSNRFAIPGVLALGAMGGLEPALAQARCEGAWSDDDTVVAALASPSFDVEPMDTASPPTAGFGLTTRYGVRSGDLLELRDASGVITYAAVDRVSAASEPGGPYRALVVPVAAFEPLGVGSPASPPEAWTGEAGVMGWVEGVAAELSAPLAAGDGARLRFLDPVPAGLEPGHWASWSDGTERVWLRMDTLETSPAAAGSPPELVQSRVQAVALGPAWRELGPAPPAAAIVRASVLTLELRVTGGGDVATLTGVGLTPAHPAAWWGQVTDAELYRPDETTGAGDADPALPGDVPRFPLARADGPQPLAWVPLGVEPLFGAALAPLPEAGTALERDGLAPFAPDLFLDPELAGAAVDEIPELADAIRFLRTPARPLLMGLHAGLSVGRGGLFNEATLLAIPDAVHPGWDRRTLAEVIPPHPAAASPPAYWAGHRGPCTRPSPAAAAGPDYGVFLDCRTRPLAAPELFPPEEPVPPGAYRLAWTNAEPGGTYVLLEATQPDFSDAREVYRGPDTTYVALEQREGVYYYQVAVLVGDEQSTGSDAIAVQVRADEWVLRDPATAGDELESAWLAVHRAALRLAAAGGDLFAALALPRHFRTEQAVRYTQRLRAVNEPRPGAAADPAAFDFAEARALSYGAVYFPWLSADVKLPPAAQTGSDGAPPTRRTASGARTTSTLVPPDGAALGVLAGRASDRGAWVGAANQPLRDVVALFPPIPASDRLWLQEARINLVRDDPRGFLTLSASTLAEEPELVPINVRRLLTLLRRLALRRGQSYVFEPHGPALRRAVERGFDVVLTELFRRGAFAGATAEDGFRVVVDDTVNPPASVEAGRLVVELRIAPSRPLTFLTVRLAQSGPRLSITEEL